MFLGAKQHPERSHPSHSGTAKNKTARESTGQPLNQQRSTKIRRTERRERKIGERKRKGKKGEPQRSVSVQFDESTQQTRGVGAVDRWKRPRSPPVSSMKQLSAVSCILGAFRQPELSIFPSLPWEGPFCLKESDRWHPHLACRRGLFARSPYWRGARTTAGFQRACLLESLSSVASLSVSHSTDPTGKPSNSVICRHFLSVSQVSCQTFHVILPLPPEVFHMHAPDSVH